MVGQLLEPAEIEARKSPLNPKVSVTKALVGGAYSAKDVLSESATNNVGTPWVFDNVLRDPGGKGYIVSARAISETTAITAALSLFLYRKKPTCELDDNAANTAPVTADNPNYICRLDFPPMEAANLSAAGNSEAIIVPGQYFGLPKSFELQKGSRRLYGVLVTRDAPTFGAGDDMTIELQCEKSI
jgi:hypothetical protein